jgi:hypothetical protein
VLFWKDKWLNTIVSDEYPRAFSYSLSEDVTVQCFLSATSLAENFNLPLSPEALQEVRNLQGDASHITIHENTQDKWTYEWASDKYSSRLFYNIASWNLNHYKKSGDLRPSILVAERSLCAICDHAVTNNCWSPVERH